MPHEPDKPSQPVERPVEGAVQGEGDYVAGRRFQDAERSFADKKPLVERKAREAADALDGPEGAELEQARRSTGEERTAEAVSARMFMLTVAAFALWSGYGLMLRSWPLLASNLISLALAAAILLLKLRFRGRAPSAPR